MAFDRNTILQAAQRYAERRRFHRAIAEYKKVVADNPTDVRTLLKIGDLLARVGSYPEAIDTYHRVSEHYLSHGLLLKAIAVLKQIDELVQQQAPELRDRYAHVTPTLADIYAKLGLVSDALQTYDGLAQQLLERGKHDEALLLIGRMRELDATNPVPHVRMAEVLCQLGRNDEAIDHFSTAAELLIAAGHRDDALTVIDRLLHFRADARFALMAAELYVERGTPEAALGALGRLQICIQSDPHDRRTLEVLARAFELLGQSSKAVEVRKEIARIAQMRGERPTNPEGLAERKPRTSDSVQHQQAAVTIPASSRQGAHFEDDFENVEEYEIEITDSGGPPAPKLVRAAAVRRSLAPSTGRVRRASELEADVVSLDADAEQLAPSDVEIEDDPIQRAHVADQIKKAIVDAEAYRSLRLFNKALEPLRIALELEPRSLEARKKLCEVLSEAGERNSAIDEYLTLARLAIEADVPADAEKAVGTVLGMAPGHAAALEILDRLRAAGAPLGQGMRSLRAQAAGQPSPGSTRRGASALVQQPGAVASAALPSAGLPSAALHEARQDALDEAEFFASRELFDDALLLLRELAEQSADDPEVVALIADVERRARIAAESGTRVIPASAALPLAAQVPLGSQLARDFAPSSRATPTPDSFPSAALDDEAQLDVEKIFAKFKETIKQQVSDQDSATHYDLGLAYKEMGLLDDAIAEFRLAADDPKRACTCHAMIGMVYLEQGALDAAIGAYEAGLAVEKTPAEETSLYYDLGSALELKGELVEALVHYKKVARREPNFRGIQEKVRSLEARLRSSSGSRSAY